MTRFNPETDYYEILQVHPRAHQEVIKRAYHTIHRMLSTHPDLGGKHEDAVLVNEAYAVLSDEETRKAYDLARGLRVSTDRLHLHTPKSQAAGAYARHGAAKPAGAPPPPRAQGQAPPATPAPKPGVQTLYCSRCGARNRLAAQVDPTQAVCGRCGARLAGGRKAEDALPSGDLKLPPHLMTRLITRGEVRLQPARMPTDRRLTCRHCLFTWYEMTAAAPPAACPRCHRAKWSDFRLFRCRHCNYHFSTRNMHTWPYWLYKECPNCHQRHWHVGCEKHPLKWIMEKLGE